MTSCVLAENQMSRPTFWVFTLQLNVSCCTSCKNTQIQRSSSGSGGLFFYIFLLKYESNVNEVGLQSCSHCQKTRSRLLPVYLMSARTRLSLLRNCGGCACYLSPPVPPGNDVGWSLDGNLKRWVKYANHHCSKPKWYCRITFALIYSFFTVCFK